MECGCQQAALRLYQEVVCDGRGRKEGANMDEKELLTGLLAPLLGTANHTPPGDHLITVGTEAQRNKMISGLLWVELTFDLWSSGS